MKIENFIDKVKKTLGLNDFEKAGKKKSVKKLLKMLYERKVKVSKALEEKPDKKELKEELDIISLHVKKGEKIFDKLNS